MYQRKKERVGLHFIISLFLSSHSRSGATKAPRTKAPHGPDWLICRRECPYGMECIHNKCVRTKRAFDVLNREFHRQRDQPSGQQSENAEYLCNPPCKLPNICSDAGLCLPLEWRRTCWKKFILNEIRKRCCSTKATTAFEEGEFCNWIIMNEAYTHFNPVFFINAMLVSIIDLANKQTIQFLV